jgi:hypothetical protein
MNFFRVAVGLLALGCVLAFPLASPGILAAEGMEWSFTEVNDPDNKGRLTARLGYGVPETDNVQVSGVCDGAPGTGAAFSSVTFGADNGDLKDGAETELRFSGGGFDHAMKGAIYRPRSEEDISGVRLDIKHDDPLWQALQEKDTLDYLVPGYRASSLDLTHGRDKIKSFIEACRAYAKAASGDDTSAASAATPEKEAFESAKELGTAEAWQAFLSNYPSGFHADLARAYLKKLGEPTAGAGTAPPPPPAPQAIAAAGTPTEKATSVACTKLGSIRSKYSNRPTKITFVNNSGGYRGILWIDFKGQPKDYANLQAGQQITLDTFQTHPWMVTDGPGNCLQMALPLAGPSLVAIGKAATAAPKPQAKKKCKRGYQLVDDTCIKKQDAATHCGPGYRLQGGKCVQGYQPPKPQVQRPAWQIEAIKKGCKPGMGWNPQEGCHEND